MKVGNYILANPDKVERALNGTPSGPGSETKGGVANAEGKYDEKELIAEYDRLGGYITDKEGSKVKTGSFYDFKNKQAKEKPEVVLIFRVNGAWVEVPEDKEKPAIVKAAKVLEKAQKEERTKRGRKSK